jgi:hypothetical protein
VDQPNATISRIGKARLTQIVAIYYLRFINFLWANHSCGLDKFLDVFFLGQIASYQLPGVWIISIAVDCLVTSLWTIVAR